MHEFYLQKLIFLQFVKMMGMREKTKKKNKTKKNLFGYPSIPPFKIWRLTVFWSPNKLNPTLWEREPRLMGYKKRRVGHSVENLYGFTEMRI